MQSKHILASHSNAEYLHTFTVIMSFTCTRRGFASGMKSGNQLNMPGEWDWGAIEIITSCKSCRMRFCNEMIEQVLGTGSLHASQTHSWLPYTKRFRRFQRIRVSWKPLTQWSWYSEIYVTITLLYFMFPTSSRQQRPSKDCKCIVPYLELSMSSGASKFGWSKRNKAFGSATGKWLWNLTT